MTIMIKIMGILMVLFGIYILGMNWHGQIQNYRNKKKGIKKYSSPLPFIGPILICVGYNFAGFPFTGLIFLAFLRDPDTVLTILGIPWFFIGLFSRKSKDENK